MTRTVSESDARSRRIRLTEEGLALVDRLMGRHVANEQRLVAGLTEDETVPARRPAPPLGPVPRIRVVRLTRVPSGLWGGRPAQVCGSSA